MKSFSDIEKEVIAHAEYGEDIRPVRDWLILLCGVAVLLIASVLWNVWAYTRVVNGEMIGSATAPAPIVDTNAIDAVQNVFQSRAAEEVNYKGAYHFVDPSK